MANDAMRTPHEPAVELPLTDLDRALLGELLYEEVMDGMAEADGIPTPEIHNLMRLWHMMTRNNVLVDRDPDRRGGKGCHPSNGGT